MRPRTLTSIAAAALLAAGCGKEAPPVVKQPVPVRVAVVAEYSSRADVRYSANIVPREEVALAFKVGGYVSEILQLRGTDGRMRNVQEGDEVRRGAVLARIEETDYAQRRDQARAQMAEAQASATKSAADFERAQRLFASQSLTKPDMDAAQAAFDGSLARLEAAKSQLEQAETSLRDTRLRAPFDGLILSRSIEVGLLAGSGTKAFTIADISSVKAVFGVPDTMVRHARMGLAIPVTTEVHGEQVFPGRISSISPQADPSSRVFEVELTIPNPRAQLKPGMIATATVPEGGEVRPEVRALVAPLGAIVKRGAGAEDFSVFAIEESGGKTVARARAVKVGEVYGNRIALLQGARAGERVVTTGASLLVDGDAVRIIP